MKKIFNHIGMVLSVALLGLVAACTPKEINELDAAGLSVKVFFPTKVVAGQPMTVNGTGLADVREVVFPGGVTVTDIEHVGGNMLRLTAPAGISSAGGKLVVRTADDQAESKEDLTLGHTVVSGFSKQDGEDIEGGEQLTVFGTDLEFISSVVLLDADGNPLILEDDIFYRKGTSSVIISYPKQGLFEGPFVGYLHTFDGQVFPLPELNYVPYVGDGHWETQEIVVWEGSKTSTGFSNVEDTGTEDDWANAEIAEGDVIRIYFTTTDPENWAIQLFGLHWGAFNHAADGTNKFTNSTNPTAIKDGYLEIPVTADIVAELTAKAYWGAAMIWQGDPEVTVTKMTLVRQVWVDGGGDEGPAPEVIWENETGEGPADWGNLNYRFGLDGHDGNNECDATFPQEIWDRIKSETFYALLEGASPQVRITDGWWSATPMADIQPGNELLLDNGDGTWTLVVNISGFDDLLAVLDSQHLLFTGGGFTLLQLFFQEGGPTPGGGGGGGGDEPGGGGDTIQTEGTVIWDTETAFADWSATILIGADKFADAKAGDIVRVYIKDKGGDYNPIFKHEDWSDWTEFQGVKEEGDGYFQAAIPESAVEELKSKGLRFQGVGFTVAAVTLIQEGAIQTEGTVIWDTETAFADWGATILLGADKFADAKAGDIVRVYLKEKSDDYNPIFKHAEDWSDWAEFQGVKEDGDGYFQAAIPESAVEELKSKGLRFQGIGFTVAAITIVPGPPQYQGTVIWDTETAFADWSATILIGADKFADAKAGDIVRVYIKDKGGDYNPIFKHEDWSDWTEFQGVKEEGDGYFQAAIPESAVEELKSKGLRFQGVGFTLAVVTLL